MKKSRMIFTLFLFIIGTYSLFKFLEEPTDSLRSPAAIKAKEVAPLVGSNKNKSTVSGSPSTIYSKTARTSLAFYIEGNLPAAFEQLKIEIDSKMLSGFQLDQSLDRLPFMYKGALDIQEDDVIKLLQTLQSQSELAADSLQRVEADISTLKILSESPSLSRLFQLNDEFKKRGTDKAMYVTDSKRLSFLVWSQKYAYRKWAQEQSKDSALEWLYFSGLAGYQNLLTGVDELQEYVARCEGKKIAPCKYVDEAIKKINLAHDMQKNNR